MNHPSLSPDDLKLISAEQDCLARVSETLIAAKKRQKAKQMEDDELVALRDQLSETRAEDHAMIVEHMTLSLIHI